MNNGAVQISKEKKNNYKHFLFADNWIIVADSEDKLQIASHNLNKILRGYGLTISVEQSK
jgi:hypothetical protein